MHMHNVPWALLMLASSPIKVEFMEGVSAFGCLQVNIMWTEYDVYNYYTCTTVRYMYMYIFIYSVYTVSVKKKLKYVRWGTVMVLCWCGRSIYALGTLLVRSWFALGALLVRSWFALGTLMVRSRVQLTNRYGTVRGSVC